MADQFVTYSMEDGTDVYGEFSFVTGLEWFEDRNEEIRLIKRTYKLMSEEVLVLPDPYQDDEEGDLMELSEAVDRGIIDLMEEPPS